MKYFIMFIVMTAISIGYAESPSIKNHTYKPAAEVSAWRWKNFDDCRLIYRFNGDVIEYSCSDESHDHRDYLNEVVGSVIQRVFVSDVPVGDYLN